MNQILLALLAGAGFALAGLLGVTGVAVRSSLRLASVAIAAGILLAITVADLIPDAYEAVGRTGTAFGFVLGFLVLFTLEQLTKAHVHHHDSALHAPSAHGHAPRLHAHSATAFILGLSLHNLTDGLAIGTTTALPRSAALAVTIGVLVHQLPVGISFASVLGASPTGRRRTIQAAIMCAAMIPLGAIIVIVIPFTSSALGVLVAAAGGALTYVACGHLLPEAQSEHRHLLVAPIFAAALLVTTVWFTQLSS